MPAALALGRAARLHTNPHAAFLRDFGHLDGAHRRTRRVAHALHRCVRHDEQEAQLLAESLELLEMLVLAEHFDFGVERTADGACDAKLFELQRHGRFERNEHVPVEWILGNLGQHMPGLEEYGLAALAWQEPPDLIARIAEDGS